MQNAMPTPNSRAVVGGCALLALVAFGCRVNPMYGDKFDTPPDSPTAVNSMQGPDDAANDGGPSSYHPTAVSFKRASNNYLVTGELNGALNVSHHMGTFSVWLKFTAGDGEVQQIVEATSLADQNYLIGGITRTADNHINFNLTNCFGLTAIDMSTQGTYTTASGWIHVLASWNVSLGVGAASIVVNGVPDTKINWMNELAGICYDATEWGVGGLGSGQLDADVADFYANFGTYLDVESASVQAKFIQNGKPVDLGDHCSKPTEGVPMSCLTGPVNEWNLNLGTGGGTSLGANAGVLTQAPSAPG
jgi:hypothetical protein